MSILDLFDYPNRKPAQVDPELKALAERVRKHVKDCDVVMITAKEGGGSRHIVDSEVCIHLTAPKGSVWEVTRTKPRPTGGPLVFDVTKPIDQ